MDARTREALEASIRHHERCLAQDDPYKIHLTPKDCAFCSLFYNRGCTGCPVADQVRDSLCGSSPFEDADTALHSWRRSPENIDLRDAYRAAEKVEIDFLKSLRPVDEPSAATTAATVATAVGYALCLLAAGAISGLGFFA